MFVPKKDDERERFQAIAMQQAESKSRHLLSRQVGVSIIFWQTLVFDTAPIMILVFVLCVAAYLLGLKIPLVVYPLVEIAACSVVFLWRAQVRLKNWEQLVWNQEAALNMDLDGDGQIGRPILRRLKVDYSDRPGHMRTIELAGLEEDILDWLRALADGESVSEETWAGNLKPFSQDEVRHNRDELLKWSYARWKNPTYPTLGIVVTQEGEVWIRRTLAQRAAPPLPQR